ncbi:ABC transporter substrate-binding protein [Candidatus Pantoea persica]|uniref:ABC transporter substrate-binding protein n=1 Tax=Candidatus Pantoea persica TaxID=2518128 RepID=UPI00215DB3B4|nr:ABC transporter substrate-binding protein [Candidatus Pantoea persica]MBA2815901.1 corrinoid ABC transporter substrate-binding protein [Candidatus Pantoea persica]
MKTLLHASLLALGLAAAGAASAMTITDDLGQRVEVPHPAQLIADAWYTHHSLLMTLGSGNCIVVAVNHPQDWPRMFQVQSSLRQALQAHGVDAIFVPAGDPDAVSYRQAAIPTLSMQFTTFDAMQRSLLATAQVVDTAAAQRRAAAYNRYLEMQIAAVTAKTAALTSAQRPRVLHIQSLHPLKIDGSATLIDRWIRLAGGQNAAAQVTGNMKEVSPEQVIAWDPDVIILGAGAGSLARSDYAALFSGLKAVRQHRVLQNLSGVFPWDRYGTEAAQQIQWAAKQLHPELFPQLDMVKATQRFYQSFFDYPLRPDEARRIIAALPPISG